MQSCCGVANLVVNPAVRLQLHRACGPETAFRNLLWGQGFGPAAGLLPGAERYEFFGNALLS